MDQLTVDVVQTMTRLGGVGSFREIVAATSRRALRGALDDGQIERRARGRYVLGSVSADRRTAVELAGTCSHLSAALHWGWKVKWPPDRAWVTVRRKRHLAKGVAERVHVGYADLRPDEVVDGVTAPLRTVIDCARRLPCDEALAVADSALRSSLVDRHDLREAAAKVRGRGAGRVRRVAAGADERAANPFESVLRALALEQPGLLVVPQLGVLARGRVYHPDLVDERRRLVIEADSWEFHATKDAHGRDCVRYTALTLAGWLVVRFTWEQVMLSPAYVREVLAELAERPITARLAA